MSNYQSLSVVRPPRKRDTRNTQDEFRCPVCMGMGEFDEPHDEILKCGECRGDGWIRWRPFDLLDTLRGLRRFRHPRYQELRARAFAKVRLN